MQLATIIFTNRLHHSLTGLGIPPSNLYDLFAGVRTSISIETTDGLKRGYVDSIHKALYLAVAWAGIALAFALLLPWPRLKDGVTCRRVDGGAEAGIKMNNSSGGEAEHD